MTMEIDFEVEAVRLGLPLYMKSKAAARMMCCGGTKLRELVHTGEIEGRKRGKDLLIKTSSILRYNASLPRAQFMLPKIESRSVTHADKTTPTSKIPTLCRGSIRRGARSGSAASPSKEIAISDGCSSSVQQPLFDTPGSSRKSILES